MNGSELKERQQFMQLAFTVLSAVSMYALMNTIAFFGFITLGTISYNLLTASDWSKIGPAPAVPAPAQFTAQQKMMIFGAILAAAIFFPFIMSSVSLSFLSLMVGGGAGFYFVNSFLRVQQNALNEALHVAIDGDNLNEIERLIAQGADANAQDPRKNPESLGNSALERAQGKDAMLAKLNPAAQRNLYNPAQLFQRMQDAYQAVNQFNNLPAVQMGAKVLLQQWWANAKQVAAQNNAANRDALIESTNLILTVCSVAMTRIVINPVSQYLRGFLCVPTENNQQAAPAAAVPVPVPVAVPVDNAAPGGPPILNARANADNAAGARAAPADVLPALEPVLPRGSVAP